MTEDFYLQQGLRTIPRLMGMANLNKLSASYGCFDRAYWHYRCTDFPSGVYQYSVLPLALAYKANMNENPFYQNRSVLEIVEAGINFAQRSSHSDGSCDDYYYNERAAGATAFSLYALTEAYGLLNLSHQEFCRFFKKRGDWLIQNNEPHPLANHQSLMALGLWNVFLITGDEKYRQEAQEKILSVLGMFCEEGWFEEYGGLDPGYLTFTIAFLAKYYQKTQGETLLVPLSKAVEMANRFLHPDGSYGGDYGSRSTGTFLCHGFELLGHKIPMSTSLVDRYVNGAAHGKNVSAEDDRSIFLIAADRMQSYSDFCGSRQSLPPEGNGTRYFPKAGLVIVKTPKVYWIISGKKAGASRFFLNGENTHNDCGFIGKLNGNRLIATFSSDSVYYDEKQSKLFVRGCFSVLKKDQTTGKVLQMLLFKCGMLVLGKDRRLSKRIKALLTHLLIINPKRTAVAFERVFSLRDDYSIEDTIYLADRRISLEQLQLAHHISFAYVAGSQFFEQAALLSWRDLTAKIGELNETASMVEQITLGSE